MVRPLKPGVCILLATYNGERYLTEQINSIQRQTIDSWTLLVSDDGSSDGSCELIRDLADSDRRIVPVDAPVDLRAGAAQNFGRLMEAGLELGGQVFFFCDQDDIWEPEKLQLMLQAFPAAGEEPAPLLVHSDLAVVTCDLQPIASSLRRYMALDVYAADPCSSLLTRNFVTGCAMACNRRLLELALPLPAQAIMHDWWLALVAASSGAIVFIDRPLLKYRQHSSNTIGAVGFWRLLSPVGAWRKRWRAGNREFISTFRQSAALCAQAQLFPEGCAVTGREAVNTYATLLSLPWWKRLATAARMGLRRGHLILQVTYYIRLLTVRDSMVKGDPDAT